ncbi:hypothetical protein J3A83DRAFT_4371937 [Scleroderma citrinum]
MVRKFLKARSASSVSSKIQPSILKQTSHPASAASNFGLGILPPLPSISEPAELTISSPATATIAIAGTSSPIKEDPDSDNDLLVTPTVDFLSHSMHLKKSDLPLLTEQKHAIANILSEALKGTSIADPFTGRHPSPAKIMYWYQTQVSVSAKKGKGCPQGSTRVAQDHDSNKNEDDTIPTEEQHIPRVFIADTSSAIQMDIDLSEEGSSFSMYQEQKDPDLDNDSLITPMVDLLSHSIVSEKSDFNLPSVSKQVMADQLAEALREASITDLFIGKHPLLAEIVYWYQTQVFSSVRKGKGHAQGQGGSSHDSTGISKTKGRELGLNKSALFNGNHQMYSGWIVSIKIYLGMNMHIYNTNKKWIEFILSFMDKGSALSFKQSSVMQSTPKEYGVVFLDMLEEFEKKLEDCFQIGDIRVMVLIMLSSIQQGKHSLDEYITNFENLLTKAGLLEDDVAAAIFFRKGLHPSIS